MTTDYTDLNGWGGVSFSAPRNWRAERTRMEWTLGLSARKRCRIPRAAASGERWDAVRGAVMENVRLPFREEMGRERRREMEMEMAMGKRRVLRPAFA